MAAPIRSMSLWAAGGVIVVAVLLVAGLRSCSPAPPLGREVAPEEARRKVNPPGFRARVARAELNVVPGMPSDAAETTPDDYLIERTQYVLSYNRRRCIPNWVAWHLEASDLGPAPRSDFQPDDSLPQGFPRATSRDFRGSGFGRGHMCPSGDRTASREDNAATFLLTNVLPQADDNNQGPWNDLEMMCRELARDGNELYIVAGGSGPFTQLPRGSRVFAPEAVWKVVLVLPAGDDDLARVDPNTRVIAVSMPNRDGARHVDWRTYQTTVDAIEEATGLDFLSELPDDVEAELESRNRDGDR